MLAKLLGRPLDWMYLFFCAPFVLVLVYILPPFQAPDEAAHFYRAIQISHGEVAPVIAPKTYREGAGGAVELSAHRLVDRYCGMPNWSCKLQTRPSLAEMVNTKAGDHVDDPRRVTAFSNTVVYLPVAHAIPATAIAVARAFGLPALGWLYAGRLANGLFAIGVIWLALRMLRRQRVALLVFAIATLPMATSLFPTLCADSGVISCSLLLLALCVRLLDRCGDEWWFLPVLVIAVLYAAVAKLAYLPLALMPVGCAVAAKCPRQAALSTVLVAIFAFGVTLAWSAITHAYIFPISPDLRVDPVGQLTFVRGHPMTFIAVLTQSMLVEAPRAAVMLIGVNLSALNVRVPWLLVVLSGLTLALATLRSVSKTQIIQFRIFALIIICAGSSATFAFLYIQNSQVGGPLVEAYQGRYLLPLLPFIAMVLPTSRELSRSDEGRLHSLVSGGGILATLALTFFLALRTWG